MESCSGRRVNIEEHFYVDFVTFVLLSHIVLKFQCRVQCMCRILVLAAKSPRLNLIQGL